jgi:hypothetical protein
MDTDKNCASTGSAGILVGRLTLAGEPAGWKPALPVLAQFFLNLQ